jgi:hypothetical protein
MDTYPAPRAEDHAAAARQQSELTAGSHPLSQLTYATKNMNEINAPEIVRNS